jgi:uncharacterized repeat protein (TIGR03803 family)
MGCGAVFKVSPKGRETVLHEFKGENDGSWPIGTLLADGSGNLFGATARGGGTGCSGTGCGTVFRLAPDGTETVLYAFQGGSDGQNPWGGVIADQSGDFYGLTSGGGNYSNSECAALGCGTIYEIHPDGGEIALYAFQGGDDGASPRWRIGCGRGWESLRHDRQRRLLRLQWWLRYGVQMDTRRFGDGAICLSAKRRWRDPTVWPDRGRCGQALRNNICRRNHPAGGQCSGSLPPDKRLCSTPSRLTTTAPVLGRRLSWMAR